MSPRVRALLSLFGRVATAWRVGLVVALFGVVAFELRTGKRPFDEAVATRILQRRAVDDLEPPLPEESGVIAPLVRRCLAFDPAEQPTAQEVAEALAEARRCRG